MATVNSDEFPGIEVQSSGEGCDWELLMKVDGKSTSIFSRRGAGTFREDYRSLLNLSGDQNVEISFRIYAPTSIGAVRFIPRPGPAPALNPVPVRLCFPLTRATALKATMRTSKGMQPLQVTVHNDAAQPWAEMEIPLLDRTVLELHPEK